MEVKRVPNDCWCVICDEQMAEVEISHNGSLKVFWACGPNDREICLCRDCFRELKKKIEDVTL